jgi:hypothetical protein
LNNGTSKLVEQAVRIHDGAFLCLSNSAEAHAIAGGIDLDLGARRDVSSLVHAASNTEAALGRRYVAP